MSIFLTKSILVFLALQLTDMISTLIGFRFGAVEANAALRFLYPFLGPVLGLIVGKALVAGALGIFVATRTNPKWVLVNGYFGLLAGWNVFIICRQAHIV